MTSVRAIERDALADVLTLVEGTPPPARTGVLAADARAWIADPAQGVAAAVESLDGADVIGAALARLAPSEVAVTASVPAGSTCWAEIARHAAGEAETCIVGLACGDGGLVRRLVLLRAALVPPCATGESTPVPPGRQVFEAYFDDLMNSRFREAAAHFSADALYSHPPYAGGSERVLFTGREALWRGFEIERGPTPARQVITGFWQSGDRVFIEGVVEGIPSGGTFFSTAQLSRQGEIARYVAFYSAVRIPGLNDKSN